MFEIVDAFGKDVPGCKLSVHSKEIDGNYWIGHEMSKPIHFVASLHSTMSVPVMHFYDLDPRRLYMHPDGRAFFLLDGLRFYLIMDETGEDDVLNKLQEEADANV